MGYSATQFMGMGGTGQNTDVDTASEPLVTSETKATAVLVKAHPDNTDVVYVLPEEGGTASATNAFPLSAGQDTGWIPVPDKNLQNVQVIADSIDQVIAYMWLL